MSDPSIAFFDSTAFGRTCYTFGVPFVVVLTAVALLIHFVFDWRPVKFGKAVIANSMGVEINDSKVFIVHCLLWALIALPFALAVLWGIFTAIWVSPVILGLDIAVAPCSLMLLVFGFMNYNKNGYQLTSSVVAQIATCFAMLFILTVCGVFLGDKLWMSGGFLCVFPGIIVYILFLCLTRRRLKREMIVEVAMSEQAKENFITENSDGKSVNWVKEVINEPQRTYYGFGGCALLSIGFSLLFLFYWGGEAKEATYATCFGSILVDLAAMLTISMKITKMNAPVVVFAAIAVKNIAVAFSEWYWMAGHAVILAMVGPFFLYRLPLVLLGLYYGGNRRIRGEENLDENVLDQINGIRTDDQTIAWPELATSIITFAVFLAAALFEVFYSPNWPLPPVFSISNLSIDQADLLVASIFLCVAISVIVALHYQKGRTDPDMVSVISIFASSALVWIVCWIGVDLRACDVNVYICTIFTAIVSFSALPFKLDLKEWPQLSLSFLGVASLIVLTVLPIFGTTGTIGAFIVTFITSCVLFFLLFIRYDLINEYRSTLFIAFCVVHSGFLVASVFALPKFYYGAVFFIIVSWAFILIWRVSTVMRNDWKFDRLDFAFTFGPSAVILVLSIVFFFINRPISLVLMSAAVIGVCASTSAMLHGKNITLSKIAAWSAFPLETAVFVIFAVISGAYFAGYSTVCAAIFIASTGYVVMTMRGEPGEAIAFTELFFPIMRLRGGEIRTLGLTSACLALSFSSLWGWGLFSTVFFSYPSFGIFGQTLAYSLAICFITGLLCDFDERSLLALSILDSDGLSHSVSAAIRSVRTAIAAPEPEIDTSTYENFVSGDAAKVAANKTRSKFVAALKAELVLLGELRFAAICAAVRKYMSSRGAEWSFVAEGKKYTLRQKAELIYVSAKLVSLHSDQIEAISAYDEFVQQQERKRIEQAQKMQHTEIKPSKKEQIKKFVDPDFYPSRPISSDDIELLRGAKFERGEDIFTAPVLAAVSPEDIRQGILGDCYLLSAMSSLSQSPSAVESVFDRSPQRGSFCVKFRRFDKPLSVIVDSTLPTRNGKPIMAQPRQKHRGSWWFCVAEKAYAKLSGSFTAIEGGRCHEALSLFVDGLPRCVSLESAAGLEMAGNGDLFSELLRLHRTGSFLCAGSLSGNDTETNELGVVLGHAYSILSVQNCHGFKLLKLRNPWGDSEWRGDWSDKSPLWSKYPDVAKELKFVAEEDGVFWISFADFAANFRCVYMLDRMVGFHRAKIEGELHPGEKDGANGCRANSPELLHVQNYTIRFSGKCNLYGKIEKSGATTDVRVYCALNDGKPLTRLYQGVPSFKDYCPDKWNFESFVWPIEHFDQPWTFCVSREKNNENTKFIVQLWCEKPFEVEEIKHGEFPPHKIIDSGGFIVKGNDEENIDWFLNNE